ncbi:MAG TPA: riboflavin synthase [Cryomorphaceae bacterium]|nr:riboflavin synthase [Cryomorphaceae bacterium]
MFTGIIEALGTIKKVTRDKANIHFDIESDVSAHLKIDQSVAHDGTCLTVVEQVDNTHRVTAIRETLLKTNLGSWKEGARVNLERCMPANGRFDGHIVQGHVDTVGKCVEKLDDEGSWRFRFTHPEAREFTTVPKGSITINGVSLTVVDSEPGSFSVAIIPYTYQHTGFKVIEVGAAVNLEFDIVGKYVARLMNLKG